MNILLSSAGRRPYLVRWFQDALVANGLKGKVVVADLDEYSPIRAFADEFVAAPRVSDASYSDWLVELLAEREIELAISINDFELSEWAQLPAAPELKPLVRVSPRTQSVVEDKLAMGRELVKFHVGSPATWLGCDLPQGKCEDFVTKGRFGSASRGLRFASASDLDRAITAATHEVTDRRGVPAYQQSAVSPRDLVVVQEKIVGTEFGLDVVCDLDGKFAGVLARKKIAMRAGETDRAVSVGSADFEEIAKGVAAAIPHPGTFDVDVIVDSAGDLFVIDINPRFGGGYPFSHVAGARVPSAYVAWARGAEPDPDWLVSAQGIVAGKFVEISALPGEWVSQS